MSPTCCGQKAKWTVISHNLSYWYCGECKQEVNEESADQLRKRLSSTPTKAVEPVHLTQEEIDELFNNIGNQRSYPYNGGLPADDDSDFDGLFDDDSDLALKVTTYGVTIPFDPNTMEIKGSVAFYTNKEKLEMALKLLDSSFIYNLYDGLPDETI